MGERPRVGGGIAVALLLGARHAFGPLMPST
jgi:hypothetical protein